MKFLLFIAGILGLFSAAQAQTTVRLKQEHLAYAVKNFYIQDVADDRKDKNAIGSMKGENVSLINLQNGAGAALKSFIANNVTQEKRGQAIVLHITKLKFTIKKAGEEWAENADVAFSFFANGKKLLEYSGRGTKRTDVAPLDFIDEFIRKALENDFRQFDSWWAQNGDRVPVTSAVKVNAVLSRTSKNPDNIVYSLQRPLQVSDFQGPVENNVRELAVTASGVGRETSGEVMGGQLVLNVIITPYFSKSKSWFKKGDRNAEVLAHEQTHFNISAINACGLVNKIKNTAFTQDNYDQLLDALMAQNNEAIYKEQLAYDTETDHGRNKEKQLEWEHKIDQQVRELNCYAR